MLKLFVFLGLVLAAAASPEQLVQPSEVAPELRQLPNFNFSGINLSSVNITGLNFTSALQNIQDSINSQIQQFLSTVQSFISSALPSTQSSAQPASQVVNQRQGSQVFIPLRHLLQPYRRQPFYPNVYNPFMYQQRYYADPAPYFARQPFYPLNYPEPSFQETDVYPRRPLQIDESLSDEEALQQLNALKQELADDQEGRLLPSISISADKHTIVIVKPKVTDVIASAVTAASVAASVGASAASAAASAASVAASAGASAALSVASAAASSASAAASAGASAASSVASLASVAASAGASAAISAASAAASSASSAISALISTVTNANLTPVITTKTILVPGISIG